MVSESDGSWRAYYRVADENIAAPPLMVKAWQRKAADVPTLFTLSEAERRLIHALEEREALDVGDVMRGCMMSRAMAEEMVIRLYALSVIDFRFIERRFLIVAANPEAQ